MSNNSAAERQVLRAAVVFGVLVPDRAEAGVAAGVAAVHLPAAVAVLLLVEAALAEGAAAEVLRLQVAVADQILAVEAGQVPAVVEVLAVRSNNS